ncbi:MAG: phosphotransferase [Myxococcota bacterium]|nr:phosphotransferase [Myxococcota bacterium]
MTRRTRHWRGADPDRAARRAARILAPGSAVPRSIRTGHNAVYRLEHPRGRRVLRISPPEWRRRSEIEAELDFIEHLAGSGLCVGRPLPGPDGRRVVPLGRGLLACQFRWLEGVRVTRFGADPGAGLLAAWATLLARLHVASLAHRPRPGRERPHWSDDPLSGCPTRHLGPDETGLRRARDELIDRVRERPETADFGTVHGDASLVNLMLRPKNVALFDFDDGCRHHFAWDLACALHGHREHPHFERIVDDFLSAYARVRPVPPDFVANRDEWLRLRTLSVLLYFRGRRRQGDAWVRRATREVLEGARGAAS